MSATYRSDGDDEVRFVVVQTMGNGAKFVSAREPWKYDVSRSWGSHDMTTPPFVTRLRGDIARFEFLYSYGCTL